MIGVTEDRREVEKLEVLVGGREVVISVGFSRLEDLRVEELTTPCNTEDDCAMEMPLAVGMLEVLVLVDEGDTGLELDAAVVARLVLITVVLVRGSTEVEGLVVVVVDVLPKFMLNAGRLESAAEAVVDVVVMLEVVVDVEGAAVEVDTVMDCILDLRDDAGELEAS